MFSDGLGTADLFGYVTCLVMEYVIGYINRIILSKR